MTYHVQVGGRTFRVELAGSAGGLLCRLDGKEISLDAAVAEPDVLSLLVDGTSYEIRRDPAGGELFLLLNGRRFAVNVRDPRQFRGRAAGVSLGEGPRKLLAPMPGKVVRLLAAENSQVEAGQGVLVVEAMKMQNEIKSPKKGVVRKLLARKGAAVNAGDVLAIVE